MPRPWHGGRMRRERPFEKKIPRIREVVIRAQREIEAILAE